MKTVIIGGVAGGATAAARLRRLNEKSQIIILEKGGYVSFANCGLPYYIGGAIKEKESLTLQTPESFKARFNIDVRIFNEALEVDPENNTVLVKNLKTGEVYKEKYDSLIVSPGAQPFKPDFMEREKENVFTLRNIPDTYKIKEFIEKNKPENALIVGGGFIGLEMAENLKEAGLNVTIVEMADQLLTPLDFDMAADVHRYIKKQGINLILNSAVKEIKGNTVVLSKGEISADMVIVCVGVKPATEFLKNSKIALNERGYILTNSRMQTNYSNIYAVGDGVEVAEFITKQKAFIPLAGPANKQGRIAADNIAGFLAEYKGTLGSSVVKLFNMTIASTGLNEKTAKLKNIDYDKTYLYSAPHATYYPGGTNMSIKVLWEKESKKLIGAQIVGFEGVDKRLDVLAAAIGFGAKVLDLKDLELCYAPPFGSAKDPVNMIGYVAENVISGKVKQFFWHDVENLPKDGSVTLLDTRTLTEVQRGKIEGFINIPLDSLRDNLDKLPKDKPIYVHCHSGLRSYIACCILSGYGYTCYNLAGGWRLYESVVNERTVEDYICYKCK